MEKLDKFHPISQESNGYFGVIKIGLFWGLSNSIADKVLALHAASLSLILSIPYGP